MTIQLTANTERLWYIALYNTPHGEAVGYGTTHYNALIACMRDITKINSLQ